MIVSCADIVGIQAARAPKCASEGKRVAILLCTFNGERHLQAQLDSIAAQSHTGWALWISDDGSTDGTLAIVREMNRKHLDRPDLIRSTWRFRRGVAASVFREDVVGDERSQWLTWYVRFVTRSADIEKRH